MRARDPHADKSSRWPQRIEALGLGVKAVITLLLFVSIVAIKAFGGFDISIRALYLIPVGAAAWALGRRVGIFTGVAGSLVTLGFDLSSSFGRVHAMFAYSDALTRLVVYVAAAEVLVQLRAAHASIAELAEADPLTRLLNRRGFQRITEHEISRSKRTGACLTMVVIDIDGFKSLNDTRGHAEGDSVLAAVGGVLMATRATDVTCRLGGDEFAILLPDTNHDQAARAVERLVARLTEAMRAHGWPITFSIGVATFDVAPRGLDELVSVADALMYEVKHSGKNGVRYRRAVREDASGDAYPATEPASSGHAAG